MGLGMLWKNFLDPAGGLFEFPSLNLRAEGTSSIVYRALFVVTG